MDSDHRPILVFTDQLLPVSNTFICSQMESLVRFQPHYIGLRYSCDIPLESGRTFVLNYGSTFGKLREVTFKMLGHSPTIHYQALRIDPCLIHAHFGPNGALCLSLERRLKVPLVVTFHGYDATTRDEFARKSYSHRMYLRRRDQLIRGASMFIAVSEFIQRKLLEQGFPVERIRVHYIGIDTDYFRPDHTVPRKPFVLFVGRLVEKKGCEYLIRAFRRLKTRANPFVIGDGPLLSQLKELAHSTSVSCQFLGKQPSPTIKEWMNKAMVLCAPSVTAQGGDSEGLPTVILEAGAMGLPVVSTFHAGIPEAVVHGETGFLVPERDEEGIAECLSVLLSNSGVWNHFHGTSMARVIDRFDLKKQTRLLEDIYESVLRDYRK